MCILMNFNQGIIVCGGVKAVWQSNLEGGRLDWSRSVKLKTRLSVYLSQIDYLRDFH